MKTKKGETSFAWTQEKINDLISLYQTSECLWNVLTEDYKSREKRDVAISLICNTLNITREQFSKKIHNLRNQFNYEAKKVYQRNDNPKNFYRSKWEYYEKLIFLKNVIAPRPGPNYVLSDYEVQSTNNDELINIENMKIDKQLINFVENKANEVGPDTPDIHPENILPIENENNSKINKCNSKQKLSTQQIDSTSQQSTNQPNAKIEDKRTIEKRPEITRCRMQISPSRQIDSQEHESSNQNMFDVFANLPPKKIIKRNPSFINKKIVQSNLIQDVHERRDEYDLFGEFVASELRNLNHEISRKKLRRRIMRVILDTASEDDDLG